MQSLFLPIIILAIVQAITEFLPVSSSGHLVIIQNFGFFDDIFSAETELFIDILLHVATLIAVIIYLRKDIASIIKGFFKSALQRDFSSPEVIIARNILAASVPAGIAGVLLNDFLKQFYVSLLPVFVFLIINGIILISTKKIPIKNRKIEEMSIIRSLMIGFLQAVAILPGISRSGMTITGGLLGGLAPNDSAKFSFLMAIPVIAGAGLLEALKAADGAIPAEVFPPLLAAMVIAVAVALVSLKVLFAVVRQVRINVFGYYTIFVGLAGIIYLALK
ncbi:MAG: undecaprenyl-diphosphate phosphatase [Spirochaetia bacterium]|jgi:undecaprenyl-diphosphatase|nr:undecaprenyl-diphosphate phosphatase [Spirochaetia bacterium]